MTPKKVREARAALTEKYAADVVSAVDKHNRRLGDIDHCFAKKLKLLQSRCKHVYKETSTGGPYEKTEIVCKDCGKELS